MRYDGSLATLRGVFGATQRIEVIDHHDGRVHEIPIPPATGGHGGGDPALMDSFLRAVDDGSGGSTSPDVSLESHLLAFAAEEARLSGATIDLGAWRSGIGL